MSHGAKKVEASAGLCLEAERIDTIAATSIVCPGDVVTRDLNLLSFEWGTDVETNVKIPHHAGIVVKGSGEGRTAQIAQLDDKGHVEVVSWEEFLRGKPGTALFRSTYPAELTRHQSRAHDDYVVSIALPLCDMYAKDRSRFPAYHPFFWNCECFVTFCLTRGQTIVSGGAIRGSSLDA